MLTVEEYIRRVSGKEREKELVTTQDHNYVKHWNAHPDSHRIRPARNLFMNAVQRQTYPVYPDEEIDVVTPDISYFTPFDSSKTKLFSNEQLNSYDSSIANNNEELDNYESLIESCTIQQKRIFHEVMDIVKSHILAKLVYAHQPNESMKQKLISEKAVKQLRLYFAEIFWDFDLILWLHEFILDKCDVLTVSTYLNIMQSLRAKVPSLVDKIMNCSSHKLETSPQMSLMLKKECDPILPMLNMYKPKKLPGNPFLLISAGFSFDKSDESPRFRFWKNYLSCLCRNTHTIHFPLNSDGGQSPLIKNIEETLEMAISSFEKKINEFKNHYPNRPVIIAGWTIGALIACYVALKTAVDAVICIGFPLTGVNGSRGDMNDILLENTAPTLFIVGQNSNMCSIDDMEDFRSRMKAETGLITVGAADDLLRVSPQKLVKEGITQQIVDRCILDEIGEFLHSLLMKLPSTSTHTGSNQIKVFPTIIEENADIDDDGKRKRRRPKEYSPELPSRKRGKYSITKEEISSVPGKSHLSPSTSETSSSSSSKIEKYKEIKSAKRSPDKRAVGRPPRSSSQKKSPPKPIAKSITELIRNGSPSKKIFKTEVSKLLPVSQLETVSPSKTTKLPFALNILPKKNDPVDVEKAFGKDSSFLPQPLTPPEPEDTISAEETEKAMAELESSSATPELPESTNYGSNSTSQITPVSEKSFMPLPEQSPTPVLTSKAISGSIIKPILSSPDTKKGISVTMGPAGFKTVLQQNKVLNSGSVSQLKNISGVKLIGNNLSSSTVNTTKTMLTVPSSSATILVSGSTLKTKSGKVLQLLSKGPISLKTKDTTTSSVTSNISHSGQSVSNVNPTEPQVCNLSLLSDVAGMTEHLKDTPRKVEPNTSATLVKLAVPDKSQSQHIKRIHILKTLQTRPSSSRIETPEEVVEKQLAIQALNKSIGVESSTPQVKETGYSICYPKTIVPRAVPHPSHTTHIARQSVLSQPSGRGRARPILPNKTYRFYHT